MTLIEELLGEVSVKDSRMILLDHIVNHQVNTSLIQKIVKELTCEFKKLCY